MGACVGGQRRQPTASGPGRRLLSPCKLTTAAACALMGTVDDRATKVVDKCPQGADRAGIRWDGVRITPLPRHPRERKNFRTGVRIRGPDAFAQVPRVMLAWSI